MRGIRVLLCCLPLLATAGLLAGGQLKTDWQKANLNGTKVEVQFPGTPTKNSSKAATQLVLEAMGGKAAYLAMDQALDKAVDINNKQTVKKILDACRDAAVRSQKGNVETEKEIKLGKYPGRQIDIKTKQGMYRTRIYLSGNNLYQIVSLGSKEFVDSTDAQKFLDSLKIAE